LFIGAGEQVTLVGADSFVGERRLGHLARHLLELRAWEDVETMILPLGHHQPTCQRFAELGGQREPPLVVQLWIVGAEKHRQPPPTGLRAAPLRTTVPHFSPQSTPLVSTSERTSRRFRR